MPSSNPFGVGMMPAAVGDVADVLGGLGIVAGSRPGSRP